MPLDVNSNVILEKNKINSSSEWLLLIKFTYENELPVRLCLTNEEVVWNSETWYPAIFSLTGIKETKGGDIPSVPLTIVDYNGIIVPILEEYSGAVGAIVDIYVVHSDYLAESDPWSYIDAEVISTILNNNYTISFQLGTEDMSNKRCPINKYHKNTCRFLFKSVWCGYSGTEISCDRTFDRCTELNNQTRFGGFPGCGVIGYLR